MCVGQHSEQLIADDQRGGEKREEDKRCFVLRQVTTWESSQSEVHIDIDLDREDKVATRLGVEEDYLCIKPTRGGVGRSRNSPEGERYSRFEEEEKQRGYRGIKQFVLI